MIESKKQVARVWANTGAEKLNSFDPEKHDATEVIAAAQACALLSIAFTLQVIAEELERIR